MCMVLCYKMVDASGNAEDIGPYIQTPNRIRVYMKKLARLPALQQQRCLACTAINELYQNHKYRKLKSALELGALKIWNFVLPGNYYYVSSMYARKPGSSSRSYSMKVYF